MNYYSNSGYQGRRSGTGGGCGCGCNGAAYGPMHYPNSYSPMYQPTYRSGIQPAYQSGNQPAYQLTNQPLNQSAYQPIHQPNQPANQMPIMNQSPAMPMPVDKQAPSPELLRMLEAAVAGETEDRIFYKQLIDLAPTSAEKDIIAGIRDDELSHFKQFRLIYRELTGNEIKQQSERTSEEQPLSYIANLRKALFGEIAAVKKYRVIRSELSTRPHRDMLFNIITDELTHMGKYNYLITLNKRN
ncbi:MAG: ferritin family protein [Paenibacillaceae bacterium]